MSPSKAWVNEVERTPTTNDFFYLGDLQRGRERPDMERKYMNTHKAQWKEPELTTF